MKMTPKSNKYEFCPYAPWPGLDKEDFSLSFIKNAATYFVSKYDHKTSKPIYNHIENGRFYEIYIGVINAARI
jgi:hypothetical protein